MLAHNRSDHTAQVFALDDPALGHHIELKAFKSYLYNDLITLYDTLDPLDQKELFNSCTNFMKHLNSNGSQHQHPMVTESMFEDFLKNHLFVAYQTEKSKLTALLLIFLICLEFYISSDHLSPYVYRDFVRLFKKMILYFSYEFLLTINLFQFFKLSACIC